MNQGGINIPHVDQFPEVQMRWNTNQEIAQFLCSAPSHPEWLTSQIRERPPSGSHLLFKRFDGNYFKLDGYEWKRRREGKLIREDHMKLKVQKQEVISANYVHSSVVPTFHRRVYWLTSHPETVLVHYLNCMEDDRDGRRLADRITQCIRASSLNLSHQHLITQISPILSPTISPPEVSAICTDVWNSLNSMQSIHPNNIPCQESPSGMQLERRNSCSSAFRSGLSSAALRRQPSTFSDSVNVESYGDVITSTYGKEDNGRSSAAMEDSGYGRHGADSLSHSGETHKSSNEDEMQWRVPVGRSSSNGTSSNGDSTRCTPIADVNPGTAPIKGGAKLLIIGGWYMKGHEYSVLFGDKNVPAVLIQVGVLSTTAPPVTTAGPVRLRVLCNKQIISSHWDFVYSDTEKEERNANLIQATIDRIHLILAAFNSQNNHPQISPSTTFDESLFLRILQSIQSNQLTFPQLLSPSLPSRTILHLAASLDYFRILEYLMWWGKTLPYTRELDPLARDSDGKTALHEAVCCGHQASARVLVKGCPQTLDVLDDRGRTPCDLSCDSHITKLTTRTGTEEDKGNGLLENVEDIGHVASTALWVLTNGQKVTDEMKSLRTNEGRRDANRLTNSTRSSSVMSDLQENVGIQNSQSDSSKKSFLMHELHVEISMDTDVHVPDSPKMADLFEAVTSPGIINDGVRAKMVILAQQIIDALPEKIKNDRGMMGIQTSNELQHEQPVPSYGSSNILLSNFEGGPPWATDHWTEEFNQGYGNYNHGFSNSSQMGASSATHAQSSFTSPPTSTLETNYFDFDKDLGEFFNVNVDGNIDTIQQWLGELKLSDGEQREVYEAAKVIQRAFREYRARNTCRQADLERKAAVTIQCCYRRYKQFCYFKKLLKAAIVVQKHFRLKKKNQQREGAENGEELPEHPTLDAQSIRIQVPPNSSSLLREHRAAVTIQHAYRGHRKRQAAARKIQKFMKESRQKLRRMHESNVGECSEMRMDGAPPSCQIPDMTNLHSHPQHIHTGQTHPHNTALVNPIMAHSVQTPPVSTMTSSMHLDPTRPLPPIHTIQTTMNGNNN